MERNTRSIFRLSLVTVIFFAVVAVGLWIGLRDDRPTIHIALAGPMTGINPENGQAILEGAQLCVEEINNTGGINGCRVVLDVFDDRNEPEAAREAAKRIVDQGRALAVVGHNYSSCSVEAGEVYRANQIPAVSPSSTAPSVTQDNPWYFRTIFTDNLEGSFLASYITEVFGAKEVAVIFAQGTYGRELAAIVERNCVSAGVAVPHLWGFDPQAPDLDARLTEIVGRLQASGHDGVVFLAVHAPAGVKLVKLLRAAEVVNTIVTPNSIASPTFQNGFVDMPQEEIEPGFFSNGIYVSSPLLYDSADEDGQRFRSAYLDRWNGKEPDWRSAFAYDAVMVLADAMRSTGVGGAAADIAEERKLIRDHLSSLTNVDVAVKGATGYNYFDERGDSRKPVSLGMFRSRNIISTLTQFQEIPNLRGISNVESEIAARRILEIDNRLMYRTDVVYVGVRVTDIDNIDLGRLTCKLGFDLWFRSRGDEDATDIVFLNAAEDLQLGEAVEEVIGDGIVYRRYRVVGTFKMDFVEAETFEQHTVGLEFVHRHLNRNHLIFVTDVLGMEEAAGESGADLGLSPASGWRVIDVQYFQDVFNRGSQGDPRLLDLGSRGVNFSRFSAKFTVQRERLAVRRFVSSRVATSLMVVCLTAVLALAVASRTRTGRRFEQLLWLVHLAAGITLLLAAEVVLVNGLMDRLGRYQLEQITRVFDVLWWVVPAFYLVYALEVFVWRPLERRADQKIPNIVRRFVAFVIYLLCFFAIVAFVYDQRITSLLATSGMIAMIIGLAIQINISNIFSGIALNLDRPFKVGDWIRIGSMDEAKVLDMTWRTTRLLLRDATVLCVPNSVAAESELINYHRPELWYELWIYFHVDPVHAPERVIKIALDALNAHQFVLSDPAPGCRFIGYTEWSGEFVAVPVLTNYAKRNVHRGAIMTHLWSELHRAGIRQAIQTQELHMLRGGKEGGARLASPQEIIHDLEIFTALPDEAKDHLTREAFAMSFAAGDEVVAQGDEGDSLFVIVEGAVGVWVKVASGEVIEVDRMGAGTFFGEMALLTGEPRTATIKAVTETTLYKITKDHVAPLLEKQPEMSRSLSETLTQRTINRESKKSAYETSQIDEQALFAKFLGKIQNFFGLGSEES